MITDQRLAAGGSLPALGLLIEKADHLVQTIASPSMVQTSTFFPPRNESLFHSPAGLADKEDFAMFACGPGDTSEFDNAGHAIKPAPTSIATWNLLMTCS